MPPHARNRPALETARPGDTTRRDTGWRRDESETGWEMLFGDGQWHPVDVRAWWEDDRRRAVVQVEFHAEMSTWTGEYVVQAERIRQADG